MSLQTNIEKQWYGHPTWLWLLAPLSGIFWLASHIRKRVQLWQSQKAMPLPCPIIVIGNIAVGGTGKTPLIIAIAKLMQARGAKVVVISRGYRSPRAGGSQFSGTHLVTAESDPSERGDEPVLIAKQAGCKVLVTDNRVAAVSFACEEFGADLILCDDGMQYYKLPRSYEIAVIDAVRGVGNGWCLPVGPLRELPLRLTTVDWVFVNGDKQKLSPRLKRQLNAKTLSDAVLEPISWVHIKSGRTIPLDEFFQEIHSSGQNIACAIAGIGNPQRFFDTLLSLGLIFKQRAFPDHHQFTAEDFQQIPADQTVLMTQKDAVKCREFARENWWALAVEFSVPKPLAQSLISLYSNWQNTPPNS